VTAGTATGLGLEGATLGGAGVARTGFGGGFTDVGRLGSLAGGGAIPGNVAPSRATSFSCGTWSTGAHSCMPARQTSDRSVSLRFCSASTNSVMLIGTTTASVVLTSHSPGAIESDTVTVSSASPAV